MKDAIRKNMIARLQSIVFSFALCNYAPNGLRLGMIAGHHFPPETVLPSKQRMYPKWWFFKKRPIFRNFRVTFSEILLANREEGVR